mgnify:CR=1 FL=1
MYRIMIIEDEFALADAIKRQIEGWGNEACLVKDFQNVMQKFTEFDPHLILIDIMLPFYNGYYWCTEIRKVSSVPVIFISSASDNMNIVMAINMGGDDFIAKPFDLNVLNAKIQAILRRTYDLAGKVPILEQNGAILNLNDMTLSYEEEKLELTNYEMIVLDLDGTLTNRDKVVTPRTKAALMKAQERGKKVVLASGRPTQGVMPLAKELRLDEYSGYILSFNGGRIINCKTGETVFARSLPVSANKKIIGLAEEHQVDIATYEGSRIISSNPESPYGKLESRINGMELWKPEDMKEYVNFEVPKFLMMEDGDYLAMVEPKVKAAMGKNFSIYRSDPFFLEVLPKGIDKAQSLERLLEVLGLTKEQMIACGDGYNDLTMIKYAGLGVAMENAVLPVRSAADYITASNNDDGVGLVVEKFMLA